MTRYFFTSVVIVTCGSCRSSVLAEIDKHNLELDELIKNTQGAIRSILCDAGHSFVSISHLRHLSRKTIFEVLSGEL